MPLKPKFLTQLPKTDIGNEFQSFFFPKTHMRLVENHMKGILDRYAEKVGKWDAGKGAELGTPERYGNTPFDIDKWIYTYLRIWHSASKPKGNVSFGDFSYYLDRAKAKGGKDNLQTVRVDDISQPMRLLLKCAWNLADERGMGTAKASAVKVSGHNKAAAVFIYNGIAPHSDNMMGRFRPSAMEIIEQFADFLGGKATAESHGFIRTITIEMPIAREKKE